MLRDVGFEVEVVGNRHILILHARVQVKQVFSIPISADGSDSSVHTESAGNSPLKADICNVLRSVNGLWHRTGEGLPLQWSEVTLWVKQMRVTTFKNELANKNISLSESIDNNFSN